MKRLVIMAAALGAAMVVAGSASAQATNPPNSAPPSSVGPHFVDANGDGICDHWTGTRAGARQMAGRGRGRFGPGNGAENQGVGPRDGSGYGQRGGSGTCNGAGPRGPGRRGCRG
jgi:hypothetical protein